MEKFCIGKYKEDAKEGKGWFLGSFMKDEIRKTDKIQFKYWKLKKGKNPENKALTHTSPEYTIILKGKLDGEIDGQKIELETGDYIVIRAGVPHHYPINIYEDVEAFTLRVPNNEKHS